MLEYSEEPEGDTGFNARIEGTINGGIVKVNFNAGFGGLFAVFKTASNDYAGAFWIEAGLRIVLFRFLFGISARAEFRSVGADPSRGELRAQIRLETPWFLPDVTWTFDATFGTLDAAGLPGQKGGPTPGGDGIAVDCAGNITNNATNSAYGGPDGKTLIMVGGGTAAKTAVMTVPGLP